MYELKQHNLPEAFFFTPHAQRERGKVIGLGVVVYIYVCGQKNI